MAYLAAWRIIKANWKWFAIAAFVAWVWRIDSLRASYKADLASVQAEYKAFRKEITDRTAAALAKEKEQARVADAKHVEALADARDDTERFIAANRVRKEGGHCSAPTAAASAGVPQEMPSQTIVDNADVRTCGELYGYAVSAYQWANGQPIGNSE